jgi:uncharacterized protein YjiS (DUF1127 family)
MSWNNHSSRHLLDGLFARAARRHAERRAVETLASMDEHLLRDIGVTRGDVARVVRNGRLQPC